MTPEVARVTAGEQRLFEIRRCGARGPEGAAPRADRPAPPADPAATTEQVAAKAKEIDWIQQELEGVRDLWKQNLVPFSRVTDARARRARGSQGERGALIASIAQAKGRIAEIRARRSCRSTRICAPRSARSWPRSAASSPSWSNGGSRPRTSSSASTCVAPQDGKVFQRSRAHDRRRDPGRRSR